MMILLVVLTQQFRFATMALVIENIILQGLVSMVMQSQVGINANAALLNTASGTITATCRLKFAYDFIRCRMEMVRPGIVPWLVV